MLQYTIVVEGMACSMCEAHVCGSKLQNKEHLFLAIYG